MTGIFIEPEVDGGRGHGFDQAGGEAFEEAADSLHLERLDHAVHHPGVDLRLAHALPAVLKPLDLETLLDGVKGKDHGLGAETGQGPAGQTPRHGDSFSVRVQGCDQRLQGLGEERVEAELETGVGSDRGQGRDDTLEKSGVALAGQHLLGGVHGSGVNSAGKNPSMSFFFKYFRTV